MLSFSSKGTLTIPIPCTIKRNMHMVHSTMQGTLCWGGTLVLGRHNVFFWGGVTGIPRRLVTKNEKCENKHMNQINIFQDVA